MVQVAATEFAKNFGRYKELAQREPIAITSHGRTSGYFVSEYEFNEYKRLKSSASKAYSINELPEGTIDQLKTVKMNTSHDHLNSLLED